MISNNDIDKVNRLYTDYRSDVVAAGLIEQGFDVDRILILRKGSKANATGKEIDDMELRPDLETGDMQLRIITNRRGIYDKIPESLFHPPSLSSRNKSKELILEEMRGYREEEFFIRRFFSLFESEVERARVNIQLTELKYDKPEVYRAFVDTMSSLWPVISLMDVRTAILFLRTVPYIVNIRNRYEWIADAMTTILGQPVDIKVKASERTPANMKFPRLGYAKLGVNFVLKGEFIDTEPVAEVCVRPLEDVISEFLPGSVKYRIVEELTKIFMPATANFRIVVKGMEDEKTNRIGSADRACCLGVNFKLGN